MKAVVHMGLPKTGTTSLQVWLRRNGRALQERGVSYNRLHLPDMKRRQANVELGIGQVHEAGILHPHTQTRRYYGLTDMSAQSKVAATYLAHFQRRVKKIGGDFWVFSSEDLGSLTKSPEMAAALDRWMKHTFDEVHYVVYLRRQEDMLLSRYSQVLRHGDTRTLDQFVSANANLDYHAVPNALSEGVGRDRFSLRLLEPDFLTDGDLIADFAGVAGFDHRNLVTPPRRNEAFSVPAAEFMRQANLRWPVSDPSFQRPTPILRHMSNRLTRHYPEFRKLRLTQTQIDLIRAENSESNGALRAAYFPERDDLFPAKPKLAEDAPGNDPTPAEMARIGLDFWHSARMGNLAALEPDEIADLHKAEGTLPAAESAQAQDLPADDDMIGEDA